VLDNKWISVKYSLPKLIGPDPYCQSSESVLVFDGKYVYIGYLYVLDDEYGPEWVQFGRDGYKIDNVTHWMPLPKLPDGA
jgi:hypothetical protein